VQEYLDVARQIYPPRIDPKYGEEFPDPYEYEPLIAHFGTVAIQVSDEDFNGDTRILYADTGKGFGYLQFGWGSCSGNDALRACQTYRELAKLIDELASRIRWVPAEEMLRFFVEHDWEGDYSWQSWQQKQFVDSVISFLRTLPGLK